MTVDEVATELGISKVYVRKMCNDGVFGRKFNGVWLIYRDEVEAYQRRRRPVGRPRKA